MGIKLTGRATNVQHQLGVTTAEIELPKVDPKDLKVGDDVLIKMTIGRLWHNGIKRTVGNIKDIAEIDDVVAILPPEVKEEVKESATIKSNGKICNDCKWGKQNFEPAEITDEMKKIEEDMWNEPWR